jgi:hypothetical protein
MAEIVSELIDEAQYLSLERIEQRRAKDWRRHDGKNLSMPHPDPIAERHARDPPIK